MLSAVSLAHSTSPPLASFRVFCFYRTSTPHIYTLSLHDALPISVAEVGESLDRRFVALQVEARDKLGDGIGSRGRVALRSEEHTSELQSHSDLVCRLLLEKKKKKKRKIRFDTAMRCKSHG